MASATVRGASVWAKNIRGAVRLTVKRPDSGLNLAVDLGDREAGELIVHLASALAGHNYEAAVTALSAAIDKINP